MNSIKYFRNLLATEATLTYSIRNDAAHLLQSVWESTIWILQCYTFDWLDQHRLPRGNQDSLHLVICMVRKVSFLVYDSEFRLVVNRNQVRHLKIRIGHIPQQYGKKRKNDKIVGTRVDNLPCISKKKNFK